MDNQSWGQNVHERECTRNSQLCHAHKQCSTSFRRIGRKNLFFT
jgi:hypothetical protein